MAEAEKTVPIARYEPRDVGERFIWGAVALLLGVVLGLALLVWWLYPQSTRDRTLSLPLPVYPAPRLQADPAADLRAFHAQELERLNGTGWVDRSQGIVHIPIEEAMREIAQEGIRDWPTAPGAPPTSSQSP